MDPFQTEFYKFFKKKLWAWSRSNGLWTWSKSKGQAQDQVQDLVLNGRAGAGRGGDAGAPNHLCGNHTSRPAGSVRLAGSPRARAG